jgi:ABC-2 type transport system ATP-binding protein
MLPPVNGFRPAREEGHAIELSALAKAFRGPTGPVNAVVGIDVTIERGETVALLGPNGAGKSTTIDMMLGLLPPDSGTAKVFGRPPRTAVSDGIVGAMLQSGALIQYLSVRELLTMMAGLYPDPVPVDDVIASTGLGALADRRTNKLSGGETQRARFALALVSNPELLVLDEPTVAMDVEARRAFWATMRSVAASGKTVIFATHYIEEADAYADRVVLMAHGRIVADGPPTEIKARVGHRTIRATLAGVPVSELSELPGVTAAEHRGEAIVLICTDSDQAIRALLNRYEHARDIEIAGAALEDAFLELTSDPDDAPNVQESVA